MDFTDYNPGITQLILLALCLVPAILFFWSQQATLQAIEPENRVMAPGRVWLQLIPFFGMVWQFIVVSRISQSLKNELTRKGEDWLLGFEDGNAVDRRNVQPTYNIGIAYCALVCCSIIPLLGILAGVAGLVCWIIYWIRLVDYRNLVLRGKRP